MERRRIREQQAQQIAQRLNDMRAASPEPETITISSIHPFSDREVRMINSLPREG